MDRIPDLPNEEWRDIEGYSGYKVSNYGRIKSFKFNDTRILKTFTNNKGYERVALCRQGRSKRLLVSRIVAEAFCAKPESKAPLVVDHIDTNKANNKATNLRWLTAKENTQIYFSEQRKELKENVYN